MSRIKQAFQKESGAALIPFLNSGDPDFDTAIRLFRAAIQAGADIIEIGAPYSDPLADGPVIQASAARSLQSGFRFTHIFEVAKILRKETEKALVLFTYFNPVLQYGPERFFREAANSGADGAIIPDLPWEESSEIRHIADSFGIDLIPLISPTSSDERIARICRDARGFVYCVSSLGVTGERAKMSEKLQMLVESARKHTDVPVAVGFGVSGPEQARHIAEFADGVIVGSAYIRRIEDVLAKGPLDETLKLQAIDAVTEFTNNLRAAVEGVSID